MDYVEFENASAEEVSELVMVVSGKSMYKPIRRTCR